MSSEKVTLQIFIGWSEEGLSDNIIYEEGVLAELDRSLSGIDVVYCWVDGSDPRILNKRQMFLNQSVSENSSPTRYADNDELFWSLASVLTFMPFVRRIHIVTDEQVPDAIGRLRELFDGSEVERIVVVDHKEIFRDCLELLPTFNSRSIETMLFKISNLSDKFIYFNDDFFVIRPLCEADFFVGKNLVVRGQYRSTFPIALRRFSREILQRIASVRLFERVSEKEKQGNSAKLLGHRHSYLWHDHTPHPMFLSVLTDFFNTRPDLVRRNASYRIRSHSQFGVPSLCYGLAIEFGRAVYQKLDLVYVSPKGKRNPLGYMKRKLSSAERQRVRFVCLQNLDTVDEGTRQFAFNWLRGRILDRSNKTAGG